MRGGGWRWRVAIRTYAERLQVLVQGYEVVPAGRLDYVKGGLAELGQLLRAVLHLLGMLLRKLCQAVDLQSAEAATAVQFTAGTTQKEARAKKP